MDRKKNSSVNIIIQERDIIIFRFLNYVGYANLEQIAMAVVTDNIINDSKLQASILRRLVKLKSLKYIKVFSTHLGNYYALDKLAKMSNNIIPSIRLDQLEHHDFLTRLFIIAKDEEVISEREIITEFKLVGRSGKIPDMIINDCIIEYERSKKNVEACDHLIYYWTIEQNKLLCIIYNTEDIKNRYSKFANSKTILISSKDYLNVIPTINQVKENLLVNHNDFLDRYR